MIRTTLAAIFLATSAPAATIGWDAHGPFRGVSADIYIGGKGVPVIDVPGIAAPAYDVPWEAVLVLIIIACFLFDDDGSRHVNTPEPQKPAPVPLPAGLVLMMTGLGALWWRKA